MPKDFSVDTPRLRWLERELRVYAEERIPKAARATLNGMAKRTMELWQRQAKESMTLRAPRPSKPWATNSIEFEQVKGSTRMDSMRATTGSVAVFMRQQEVGGERVSAGKHGLPIPTGYASGQSMREKRTKALQDRFRLNKLTVGAKKGPKKFVLLKRKRPVGLFHITGQKGNRNFNRI